MPTNSVTIDIHSASEAIFELIHNYPRRLEWDPFLRDAQLLHNAESADLGVVSRCTARWAVCGLAMDTVYVSFKPPTVAAVKMLNGPFFLQSFAATIRQQAIADDTTRVTYSYNFRSQPRWLNTLADPVIRHIFHRETTNRLAALKGFLETAAPM